jgi:hypothetical protein
LTFKGISDNELNIPGVKPFISFKNNARANSWREQLNAWHNTLTTLAKDYTRGNAEVSPKHPQICNYCDLANFCRIKEKEMSQ